MDIFKSTLKKVEELDSPQIYIDYLLALLEKKEQLGFLWGEFYLLLSQIFSRQKNLQEEYTLASNIELFMAATDIIDDLMDKDNHRLNELSAPIHFGITFAFDTLFSLTDMIKGEHVRNTFLKNVKESLYYQYFDMNNTIRFEQKEESYFNSSVKKSIFLVNAIEQLALREEKLVIKDFAKHFATASQLHNDINDIMNDTSYDLINRKATLPIIKGIEAYKTHRNRDTYKKINSYFFENNNSLYEDVRLLIINSGALKYSNYLAKLNYERAYNNLYTSYPNSTKEIKNLSDYLKLRRNK